MSQPIWYDSTEAGAPTLNNVAGSLLEVLRACLINGFNAKSVTSIAVASNVATATCAAHGFLGTYGKLVQISGATEPLLNGNKQPGDVLTNSFTFPAPGVADGTYTGTISARRAPLGWTEPHTGTNVAMFARSAVESTAMLLRVNDSHVAPSTATDARVVMVEAATGVGSFTAASPTEEQLAGGLYWYKGANSVTPKKWALVGDDFCFWVLLDNDSASKFMPHFFGDSLSFKSVDAYRAVVSGGVSAGGGATPNILSPSQLGARRTAYGVVAARPSSQVGGAVRVTTHIFGTSDSQLGAFGPLYPSPVDGGFVVIKPVLFSEDNVAAGHPIRGAYPGLAQPLMRTLLPSPGVVDGFLGDSGTYLSVQVGTSEQMLFDLSTPWS